MKIALNGATTMQADLATDVQVAQAAGFDYLEIWAEKLSSFLHHRTSRELKEIMTKSGVPPLSINSIEHVTFREAHAYDSIKEQCAELSHIAANLGCPFIVVVPGRLADAQTSRDEVISESVRVLAELCDIAARHDVALAFEFLGQSDCSVQT